MKEIDCLKELMADLRVFFCQKILNFTLTSLNLIKIDLFTSFSYLKHQTLVLQNLFLIFVLQLDFYGGDEEVVIIDLYLMKSKDLTYVGGSYINIFEN